MYDIAIVGGGPAGLAAAANARRRNKNIVVISKESLSSKLAQAYQIENYLGIQNVSGRELAAKMREHAEILGANFIKDEAQSIYRDNNLYTLVGRDNSVESKSVILAVGISLGIEIEGESEWIGRGISYCATCDGMFFKDKTVAVIGYIPEAESELSFLADICARVYYLPQYKAVDAVDSRVSVLGGKPVAISGTNKLEGLKTTSGELKVDGIFIERSARPVNDLLADLKTDRGFIICDQNQATNLPGVFAAGDCTGKPWQISRAVGQGQVAALQAVSWLESWVGTNPII
jgi:thioredoxin reductase (NADPH)